MNWLIFFFALEMGAQQQRIAVSAPPPRGAAVYAVASPYAELDAGVELFGFLEVGGSATILFADTSTWMFAPYDTRYDVFARARFRLAEGLALEAGAWHECIHPNLSGERPDVGYLSGGGTRAYLRLEGKVGGR